MAESAEPKLTPKMEVFCQRYVELSNASEAYRQSYNAQNMKPESVWVEACRLLQNPNVSLRVAELQMEHAERHKVTVDTLTQELEEARQLAREEKQTSTMVTASMGKAKLHGFLIDKGEITGKDGGPIETQEKSATDIARAIAFVFAKAQKEK